MVRLNSYIHLKNTTRQALEFYKTVFGGTLTMSTFKEGMGSVDPEEQNNIMHAALEVDNGILFMASDTPKHMGVREGSGMSMSLSGDDETLLKGYWDKLSAGAEVEQPLTKAPWGDMFGMLKDKFGIRWMVNITAKKA